MSAREVEDRVAEFIESSERGRDLDPTEFAGRFPHIQRELLQALAALGEAERLLPTDGDDPPARIGGYEVEGELGRGGMGRVLRVRSANAPGCALALKLLHAGAALDPRTVERFRREGELLRSLEHPNVVRVRDAGIHGTCPFLVMDHVEGRSLADLLRTMRTQAEQEPGLPEVRGAPNGGDRFQRAARVVATLARAVEAVHRAGILHRDIKPANVILRADGEPVLVDFGLAHGDSCATLTRSGDLLGTPQYMAPEQARGESCDARTDVYALGALLYELCALEPPHAGDSTLAVLERVRNRAVAPLSRRLRDVPRDLNTIAQRALAFRATRRTVSAAALADDLQAFLDGRPIRARSPGAVERLDALWTFHRTALLAGALVALLVAATPAIVARRAALTRDRAAAAFERGLRAWVDRDAASAQREALAAGELDPEHRWAPLLHAMAAGVEPASSDDPAVQAAALGWRAQTQDDAPQALAQWARAAQLAPNDAFPVVLLALEAARGPDGDRAQRELAAAVHALPASARLLGELSVVLYARGQFAAAEQSSRSALDVSPNDPRLWEQYARVQFRLGHNEAGLDAARRAVDLAGEGVSARMLLTLGTLSDVNGQRAQAQAAFERAARLEPESATVATRAAMSLDSDHRLREAEAAYWHAAQLGHPAKALMCLAYLYAGSNRAECERCRACFEDDPALYDPARAVTCALNALEADGGREDGLPATAAIVANQVKERDLIRAKLEALRDAARDDRLIARYERALRMLRGP